VKMTRLVVLIVAWQLVGGCVSTTTGAPIPEANNSEAAELNFQLGARYYNAGNYQLARDRLELAVDLNPRLGIAYSSLGLTYEQLGNLRLARESYEKAVRVSPNNIDVQNNYAVFLCGQKEFDAAARHFSKAANHPENDDAEISLTNAGLCMLEKPDDKRAEKYFRDALEAKVNYGPALLQLCLLNYKQQNYLGARAFLQRYMSSNVSTAGVLYLASEIEGKLDNQQGREKFIDQLLHDYPDSAEARKALAGS